MTHRAISSDGVAAVSRSDGTTNCGAGPAFGPTANVNAPRTGCPSAEMTRQKTRYQPRSRWRTGTSISWRLAFERVGLPATWLWPAASVTDTIANLGSMTSL